MAPSDIVVMPVAGKSDLKAFIDPARHAARHELDRTTELRKPNRCARRAVAMWAGAINDEQRLRRIAEELRFDELCVGQIHRAVRTVMRTHVNRDLERAS